MRRAVISVVLAACFAGFAPAASGQGFDTHFLAADASRPGLVTLVFFGPVDGTVRFRERVGARAVELGTRRVLAPGAAVLFDATTWRCDRRVRRFEATETTAYGKELTGSFEVRTPSCRDRLEVAAPRRVRRGARVTVRVRDTWKLGGIRPRLCTAPPHARLRCRTLTLGRGTTSASGRFRAAATGTWRVEVRLGSHRWRRAVAVGRRASAGPELPVFLTTGDSTIQGIDAFLGDELGETASVHSQYFVGTGLSGPGSPWGAIPARQVRRLTPDATVISLGANEGATLNGAACCGEAWIAEYAKRVSAMMRAYGRVVWLTLPMPRDAKRRPITSAVNAAVVRAAATHAGTRLIRLDELFTPGGVFRERIRYRGQDVQVRQPDGIHLTLPALSIAAGLVADALPERGER